MNILYLRLELSISVNVIVYPPPPKKDAKVIIPSEQATNSNPSGAPISMPLWKVEAPEVGAILFPK